jgi:hypothetical protein
MGFLVLIILIVLIIVIASSGTTENITTVRDPGENKHPENMGRRDSKQAGPDQSNYDEDAYEYYEIRAARRERDYFSEDSARDYDSYYAQVADAAEMGDQDAIDEMYGEFGEGEW